MDKFEEWFQSQDFYTNLRFIHGDALFLKDGDVYRVLVVRTASKAWQELQKRVDAVKQLIEEYRDPPTEDKTFQHALSIVADELEQALKGGEE